MKLADVVAMIAKHNVNIARDYWAKNDLKTAVHFMLLHMEAEERAGSSPRIESKAETALTLLQRYVARDGHDCGAYGDARANLYDLCTGCEKNWKAYRAVIEALKP